MGKKYNIAEWEGKRFGHLEVIGIEKGGFTCRCDCGNVRMIKPAFLFNKKMVCCGLSCKHHMESYDRRSRHPLYGTWHSMIQRCYSEKSHGYRIYGGRGIKVCDEWKNDFWAFVKWAESNGYEKGLSIDRINGDGNYEPGNCRWATAKQQRENARDPYTLTPFIADGKRGKQYEINGESHNLGYWCDSYGVLEATVKYRLKMGCSLEEALTKKRYEKILKN